MTHASTQNTERATATAALEAVASLYARCFASARVVDGPEGVTPEVLASIGRELLVRGESLHVTDVMGGQLDLLPAADWDVRGSARQWLYRVTLFGPATTETVYLAADQVVHCRYAIDPARPWLGVGPLGFGTLGAQLVSGTSTALRADLAATSATVIPTPPVAEPGDDAPDPSANLQAGVRSASGRSLFVESTQTAWGQDLASKPKNDWQQERLGPTPNSQLIELLGVAAHQVYAACGVPPTLFVSNSDGTAQREAFRRFLHSSLRPLARLVERELQTKLNAPGLALDLSELHAADVAGRARSFKALIASGVAPVDAARETGVTLTQELEVPPTD